MSCNTSVQNYISKRVHNVTLRKLNVWCKPSVSERWCVYTRIKVTLRFCHLHLHQVHLSVRNGDWLWSRRITSSKMENAENELKIVVKIHVNLPCTGRRTGNNAKMGYLTDDRDLRGTVVKVRRREIINRTTGRVQRQSVMMYVVQISKTLMNKKCN